MRSHDLYKAPAGLASSQDKARLAPACDVRESQLELATAILDPDRQVPLGLVGPDGEPSVKRFSVYRNNVIAGLVEALRAGFPAVRRIVGDDFFAAMARIYVSREPPSSPIMLDYGAGFVDFVDTFEPAATVPYLRDVTRLERAWVEAYHAAEAKPLDPAAFTGIARDQLPEISLVLHPSVRIVRSLFPAVAIWQMNIDGGVPTGVNIGSGGEDALVVRPVAEVEVRVLPVGGATFIEALLVGASVVVAAQRALQDAPGFDLGGTLTGLLEANIVVGWQFGEKSVCHVPASTA